MNKLSYDKCVKRRSLLEEKFKVVKGKIALHVYSLEQAKLLMKALDSIGFEWCDSGDLLNFRKLEYYYDLDKMTGKNKEVFEINIDLFGANSRAVLRSGRWEFSLATQELVGNLNFRETIIKLKEIRKELRNE